MEGNTYWVKIQVCKRLPSSVADRIDNDFLRLKCEGEDRKEIEEGDWTKTLEIVEFFEGQHGEDEHRRVAENAIVFGINTKLLEMREMIIFFLLFSVYGFFFSIFFFSLGVQYPY